MIEDYADRYNMTYEEAEKVLDGKWTKQWEVEEAAEVIRSEVERLRKKLFDAEADRDMHRDERDEARNLVRRLADAGEAALAVMDGGTDDALCHRGLCSRKECRQCQCNDNLHTAVAEAREALAGGREK